MNDKAIHPATEVKDRLASELIPDGGSITPGPHPALRAVPATIPPRIAPQLRGAAVTTYRARVVTRHHAADGER
ncbi:hypothetical protein ACWEJ6_53985 [Nonomuraea sp. NPDC004702]